MQLGVEEIEDLRRLLQALDSLTTVSVDEVPIYDSDNQLIGTILGSGTVAQDVRRYCLSYPAPE
jgi:hypothetical protein